MAKKKQKISKRKFVDRTAKPEQMKKGQVLVGKIIGIAPGALSPILSIVDDDGVLHRLWMSTVLEQAITPGDVGKYARLKYVGEENSKSGRPVRIYEVGIAEGDETEG